MDKSIRGRVRLRATPFRSAPFRSTRFRNTPFRGTSVTVLLLIALLLCAGCTGGDDESSSAETGGMPATPPTESVSGSDPAPTETPASDLEGGSGDAGSRDADSGAADSGAADSGESQPAGAEESPAASANPGDTPAPAAAPAVTTIPTTMPFGTSAYGLHVDVRDGKAVAIKGNPDHPSTRGETDPRMRAQLAHLYDGDRVDQVMHEGQPSSYAAFLEAWNEIYLEHANLQGEGLVIITPSFTSPTIHRFWKKVRADMPRARWLAYDAIGEEMVYLGWAMSGFGKAIQADEHLDKAKFILSVESDFLGDSAESLAHRRRFAEAKKNGAELWVIESTPTVTGRAADERITMYSHQINRLITAVANEVVSRGVELDISQGYAPDEVDPAWVTRIADKLMEHRGEAVIITGRHQAGPTHVVGSQLNVVLGNAGKTIMHHEFTDSLIAYRRDFMKFSFGLRGNYFNTVVMVGVNPYYDFPLDLNLAPLIPEKTDRTIVLASHKDETARNATWHVPMAHFLESYGDARAVGGMLGLTQPVVERKGERKSPVELLGLVVEGQDRSDEDWVKETWQQRFGGDFDKVWSKAHETGLVPGSEYPPFDLERRELAMLGSLVLPSPSANSMELLFRASQAYDGRFANLAELNSQPNPISGQRNGNAAWISKAAAKHFKLRTGDMIEVKVLQHTMQLPVIVIDGQPDWTVTLPVGYGREGLGKTADGIGYDTYRIRTERGWDHTLEAKISKVDGKARLDLQR